MRWLKTFTVSTLQSLWGTLPQSLEPAQAQAHLHELRQLMLDALTPPGEPLQHVDVVRKIMQARSIAALWYLRSDLMQALASDHGEAAARRTLQGVTERFHGLLPEAGAKGRGGSAGKHRAADKLHPTHPM